MCMKLGDDPISSLDFRFIGAGTLKADVYGNMKVLESVGKYCFPNRDSSRYFSARASYERVLK